MFVEFGKSLCENLVKHLLVLGPVLVGQLRASGGLVTQTTLKQFAAQSLPMSKSRQDFVTSKLVQMCAQDCRPLSIAEGVGFKEFSKASNQSYKPPVHSTLKVHLNLDYQKKKEQLISQLKNQDVSFTTDMWSSMGKDGYITVTYHYLMTAL